MFFFLLFIIILAVGFGHVSLVKIIDGQEEAPHEEEYGEWQWG